MAAKKKASAKPKAKAAAPKPAASVKAQMTKSQILGELSEKTGLAKKDVSSILDELNTLIKRHVKKGSVGTFALPGVLKIKTVHKPATKARKGVNPFTGEEQMFKAKPARTVVKVLPLKALKDMVN
jgi:nucleoid DNA-binding protein